MKFLQSLFSNHQAEDNDIPTSQQVEAFKTGYRLGFPLDGDAIPSIVNQSDPSFQRGLIAGRKDFEGFRMHEEKD